MALGLGLKPLWRRSGAGARRAPLYSISTTRPSRSVTRRSMRPARSRLCVAISAATRLAFTSAASVAEHVVRRLRVEIAGRLVGEQHARRVGDGARDRDTLLLAARKFGGAMVLALGEAEIVEQFARPRARLGARQAADHLRQDDVLERRELRQQVMELIDEADLGAPQRRALVVGHCRGRRAADMHLARVRRLQQAGQMQQRRLSGAGRRDQRHRLAGPEREVRAVQHLDHRLAAPVAARDVLAARGAGGARRLIHSAAPRPDRAAPRARTDRSSPRAKAAAPSTTTAITSAASRPARAAARENKTRTGTD